MNKEWQSQLPIENIQKITPVSGGDVNDAYKIESKEDDYFLLVQQIVQKIFMQPK